MGFPYSQESKGNLEDYLKEYNGHVADNHFFGPEYFFVIKEKGFMQPSFTCVRVDKSPLPDLSYHVNEDFMLESFGQGLYNMSCVGADNGVYKPEEALKDMHWSIYHLDLD